MSEEFGSSSAGAHLAEALIMLAEQTPHLNDHAWAADRERFQRAVEAGPADARSADTARLVAAAATEEGDRKYLDELVAELKVLVGGADLTASMRDIDEHVYTRLAPGDSSEDGAFEICEPPESPISRPMTVVVPFRASSPDRTRNLEACLQAVRDASAHTGDVEITVVEQDTDTRLRDIPRHLYDTHLLAVNDGPFNKAWAVNLGVFRSMHNRVCVLDADLLTDARLLTTVWELLEDADLVVPHRRVIWMDPRSTHRTLEAAQRPREHPAAFRYDGARARGFAIEGSVGACIGVRKDFYLDIGGHDERFEGWGDEDNAFYRFASGRGRIAHGNHVMPHMHHPRAVSMRSDGSRLNERARQVARPAEQNAGWLRRYTHAGGFGDAR